MFGLCLEGKLDDRQLRAQFLEELCNFLFSLSSLHAIGSPITSDFESKAYTKMSTREHSLTSRVSLFTSLRLLVLRHNIKTPSAQDSRTPSSKAGIASDLRPLGLQIVQQLHRAFQINYGDKASFQCVILLQIQCVAQPVCEVANPKLSHTSSVVLSNKIF